MMLDYGLNIFKSNAFAQGAQGSEQSSLRYNKARMYHGKEEYLMFHEGVEPGVHAVSSMVC